MPDKMANEKAENAIQSVISGLTDDSITRIIDTIDKSMYSVNELSAEFRKTELDENLPICHMPNDKRPYVKVKANRVESYPLLDMGAEIAVISYVEEDELAKFKAKIEPANMNITTVTKMQNPVAGMMWIQYQMANESHVIPTLVFKSHKSCMIVGIDFIEAFDIRLSRRGGLPKQPWSAQPPTVEYDSTKVGTEAIQALEVNGIGIARENGTPQVGGFANLWNLTKKTLHVSEMTVERIQTEKRSPLRSRSRKREHSPSQKNQRANQREEIQRESKTALLVKSESDSGAINESEMNTENELSDEEKPCLKMMSTITLACGASDKVMAMEVYKVMGVEQWLDYHEKPQAFVFDRGKH